MTPKCQMTIDGSACLKLVASVRCSKYSDYIFLRFNLECRNGVRFNEICCQTVPPGYNCSRKAGLAFLCMNLVAVTPQGRPTILVLRADTRVPCPSAPGCQYRFQTLTGSESVKCCSHVASLNAVTFTNLGVSGDTLDRKSSVLFVVVVPAFR